MTYYLVEGQDGADPTVTDTVRVLQAMPAAHYRRILVDPPWPEIGGGKRGGKRGANRHYQTLNVSQICKLPVERLAHPDGCHLWLWETVSRHEEALKVVKAWGFQYVTQIVWGKADGQPSLDLFERVVDLVETLLPVWDSLPEEARRIAESLPSLLGDGGSPGVDKGIGQYIQGSHETLLLCRRGVLPYALEDGRRFRPSSLQLERRTVHSRKPTWEKPIVERVSPQGPAVELFARAETEGWDAMGTGVEEKP